jgi:hypothetical protein
MRTKAVISIIMGTLLVSLFIAKPSLSQDVRDWTFVTLPTDGIISGIRGQHIGWGYSITNLSLTDWLVVTDLQVSQPFENATSTSLFDIPILSPGETRTLPYAVVEGLVGIQWNLDAPLGFENAGTFTLESFWFDGDPFDGGNLVDNAGLRSQPFRAIVASSAVAEPSSAFVFLIGILSSGSVARRRRHSWFSR